MFIVFEGIDGCGKTTQARLLARKLEEMGRDVVSTFEPGGWEGGERFRETVLGAGLVDPFAELFAFMSDRCEHVARVIAPALSAGRIVICDRYTPSCAAYQIFGRADIDERTANVMLIFFNEICDRCLPAPDVVIRLDVDDKTAASRLASRGSNDAFDEKGSAYAARVREGYARARGEMSGRVERWFDVDGSGSSGSVFDRIMAKLSPLLSEL